MDTVTDNKRRGIAVGWLILVFSAGAMSFWSGCDTMGIAPPTIVDASQQEPRQAPQSSASGEYYPGESAYAQRQTHHFRQSPQLSSHPGTMSQAGPAQSPYVTAYPPQPGMPGYAGTLPAQQSRAPAQPQPIRQAYQQQPPVARQWPRQSPPTGLGQQQNQEATMQHAVAERRPDPVGGASSGVSSNNTWAQPGDQSPGHLNGPQGSGPQVSSLRITEVDPPQNSTMGSADRPTAFTGHPPAVRPQAHAPGRPTSVQVMAPSQYGQNDRVGQSGSMGTLAAQQPSGRRPQELTIPALNPQDRQGPAASAEVFSTEPSWESASAQESLTVDPLAAAISRLDQTVRQDPADLTQQLTLRLLYINSGMQEKGLDMWEYLPVEAQREAIAMTRAIAMTGKAQRPENVNNSFYANEAMAALKQWHHQVAARADFQIARFTLCESGSVKGFGQYRQLSPSALTSGQPQTIQVYCELDNFASRQLDDGQFESKIAVEISLVDERYEEKMKQSRVEIPDQSHNRRRDFFFYGPVRLPSLPPGTYQLIIKVEDLVAHKAAVPGRFDFTVGGNPQ